MKKIVYVLVGAFFGLALTKGEAISWYRMQEMFRFEGFHMFGIFMTAIPTGALGIFLLQKFGAKTWAGETVERPVKVYHHGIIIGSFIFGFGWALTGACPGPLYVQVGTGAWVSAVVLLAALVGTWLYGRFQKYLPD
jgi:uncharacterized membrane protein YedE/YeeE